MIVAVMMVRNEADVIRTNLSYHLAAGVDEVLVVDNGSTDGTAAILEEYAATGRVHVSSRPGPFLQAATTTELAREAFRRGARWVLPIDADEFWHVPGGRLRDVLDDAPEAGALEVEVVNFIQHREQDGFAPEALLAMTRRVREPIGTSAQAAELVEAGRIGFVEIRYPQSPISRASVALQIAQGNHAVAGVDGPIIRTAALRCLHAPLRARVALTDHKVEQGRRVEEVNDYLQQAWHVRRWRRLADAGRLEAEWRANSYLDDALDVYGEQHPLAIDTTLADLVAPFIDGGPRLRARAARGGGREAGSPWAGLDHATTAAILDRMEQVEGWFRREEAELLLQIARQAAVAHESAAIVEIGSYCGRSTIVLASAARVPGRSARVYAIDPHDGEVGARDTLDGVLRQLPTFDRFTANIASAGVDDIVEPIRQRSFDVSWQLPIALLLVDGLHDYVSVARDFHHFEPHLQDGAFVAFHDCDDHFPGVRLFVAGLSGDAAYEEVGRAASLVVFRKRAESAVAGRPTGDDRMAAMRARLGQQERGIGFLMNEIAACERIIRQRDEGIAWLRGVVGDKEATIAELQAGVDWLREEIRRRDAIIEALRGASEPERPDRTGG